MIDTHSHLFDEAFDEDRDECIRRCRENNIKKIMIVGFSDETNKKAYALHEAYPDLFYPTAGIHPDMEQQADEEIEKLNEFLKVHKIYAIGECGLDYHYGKDYMEEQKKIFRYQVALSARLQLPLIIHMRDATKDTYDILKEYEGKVYGVMHCYSGSWEMAKEFMKLGFYISLGGPVTFKNAKDPKEVAKNVPSDRILVETDCPYLAPVPMRGKRNESSFVRFTLAEIAGLRGITLEEAERITTENAERLFKI